MSRGLIWYSLYDMVKDAKVSFAEFVATAAKNLASERNDTVLKIVIQSLYEGVVEYTPRQFREEIYSTIYEIFVDLFNSKVAPPSENRLILLRQFIPLFARKKEHIFELISWFDANKDGKCRYGSQDLGN